MERALLLLLLGCTLAGCDEQKPWSIAWEPVANSTNPCFKLDGSGEEVCFPKIIIAGAAGIYLSHILGDWGLQRRKTSIPRHSKPEQT